MNQIRNRLTAEDLRKVIDYDPATGIFRWRANPARSKEWNTRRAGKVAGSLSKQKGYIHIRIETLIQAATLAWLYVTGEWPSQEPDHKNRDRADNRWENLRLATRGQQIANRTIQKNNTSGYIGVRFRPHHGKWEARINKNGRTVWRAYFATPQEAAVARRAQLPAFHGAFANLED